MKERAKELLRDAFAIIDGIPDAAIRFGFPRSRKGPALDDGTVCSPEGWLAQHPQFAALGLRLSDDGTLILFDGEGSANATPALPMARALDIPLDEAMRLFGAREEFTLNPDSPFTDKQLWQQRVREVLGATRTVEADVSRMAETASLDPHFSGGAPL